jgi:hypothetical protein
VGYKLQIGNRIRFNEIRRGREALTVLIACVGWFPRLADRSGLTPRATARRFPRLAE